MGAGMLAMETEAPALGASLLVCNFIQSAGVGCDPFCSPRFQSSISSCLPRSFVGCAISALRFELGQLIAPRKATPLTVTDQSVERLSGIPKSSWWSSTPGRLDSVVMLKVT